MCKYCDYNSEECCIFQEWPDNSWYMSIQTSEWDDCDDDWVYEKVHIGWCPFCGEDLYHRKSCSTCKFSVMPYENEPLYKCLNTEIVLTSSLTEKFHCSKWEEREDK